LVEIYRRAPAEKPHADVSVFADLKIRIKMMLELAPKREHAPIKKGNSLGEVPVEITKPEVKVLAGQIELRLPIRKSPAEHHTARVSDEAIHYSSQARGFHKNVAIDANYDLTPCLPMSARPGCTSPSIEWVANNLGGKPRSYLRRPIRTPIINYYQFNIRKVG
jgi:hypothetical protein